MNYIEGISLSCIKSNTIIFKNINFSLYSGNILFLKGANGSGKSTLLRVVANFVPLAEGSISSNFIIQKNIHYFNEFDLIKPNITPFEHLNHWSYLLYWSSISNKDSIFHRENALYCLNLVGLYDYANTPCKMLSLGQRKRVGLSRLLLIEKYLWILDEPIIGLDIQSINILEKMIDIHLSRHGMIILSSHSNIKLQKAVSLHI